MQPGQLVPPAGTSLDLCELDLFVMLLHALPSRWWNKQDWKGPQRTRDLTLLLFPLVQLLGTGTCDTSMGKAARQDLESQGRGKSLKLIAAGTVWRERERVCEEMGLWPLKG